MSRMDLGMDDAQVKQAVMIHLGVIHATRTVGAINLAPTLAIMQTSSTHPIVQDQV